MRKLLWVFWVIGLLTLMTGPALAAPVNLAIDFTSAGIDNSSGSWSLGWVFSTNAPVTVNALGFYDSAQDGLAETHAVGIYDASGTLLVSTTVSNADPLTSWFRFHPITPYTLAAGQNYYIQAVTGTENYTRRTNGFVVDPSINFFYDAYYHDHTGVLTFPTYGAGFTASQGGGFFGPNFTTSPVPLPPSLLLLGSGLLGLAGWRRLRRG